MFIHIYLNISWFHHMIQGQANHENKSSHPWDSSCSSAPANRPCRDLLQPLLPRRSVLPEFGRDQHLELCKGLWIEGLVSLETYKTWCLELYFLTNPSPIHKCVKLCETQNPPKQTLVRILLYTWRNDTQTSIHHGLFIAGFFGQVAERGGHVVWFDSITIKVHKDLASCRRHHNLQEKRLLFF